MTGVYDAVAEGYDATWTKPSDLAENEAVVEYIAKHFGGEPRSVLDAGCGTGLAIDLGIADLTRGDTYTGFDPSPGMIEVLRRKHPSYHADVATAEQWLFDNPLPTYDLVIGLFAAPSYMTPRALAELISRSKRLTFLMAYDHEAWYPDYYTADNPPPIEKWEQSKSYLDAVADFPYAERLRINHFDVTVVHH